MKARRNGISNASMSMKAWHQWRLAKAQPGGASVISGVISIENIARRWHRRRKPEAAWRRAHEK